MGKKDIPVWARNLKEKELIAFVPTKSVKYMTKRTIESHGVNKALYHVAQEIEKIYPKIQPRDRKEPSRATPIRAVACKKAAPAKGRKPKTKPQSEASISFALSVRHEFMILLCKNSPKYRKIKNKLKGAVYSGTYPIVATISESISPIIGVPATAIMAIIAPCLLILVRVGKEALCKDYLLNL